MPRLLSQCVARARPPSAAGRHPRGPRGRLQAPRRSQPPPRTRPAPADIDRVRQSQRQHAVAFVDPVRQHRGRRRPSGRIVSCRPANRASNARVVSSATMRPALSMAMRPHSACGLLQVVGRQHDGVAVAVQAADELPQRLPQLDIDPGRRLVQHDDRRLVHQRLRDQHAALHAARQGAHVGVGLGRQAEVVAGLRRSRRRCGAGRSIPTGMRSVSRTREERIERQFLRHHADREPRRRKSSTTSCPMIATRAALARTRPAMMQISVVLPAPFGPEQAEELALGDRKVDVGPAPRARRSALDTELAWMAAVTGGSTCPAAST